MTVNAELKLREQLIDSLRGKIQEQQDLVASLSVKSDQAGQQVKDIALKAIENAGIRTITLPGERTREERKDG